MSYLTSLLIIDERGRVVARRAESDFELPIVQVESGRVGISLSRAVRAQLGLEVFLLVPPNSARDSLPMLRLQSEAPPLPLSYRWVETQDFARSAPNILRTIDGFSAADQAVGRYGWYSEVQKWLVSEIGRLGHTIHALEQWNGRVGGVLLRAITDGPDYWFKAATDFNARETSIAQLLAASHPDRFPRIMATAPHWNALLLEHVKGKELFECHDVATWERVAQLLAEVQVDWMGRTEDLLQAGAADLRPHVLSHKIPIFLDHIAAAMERQPKSPPAIFTRNDLRELEEPLASLCAAVDSLPFATGLANADFSPHNTLLTDRGPIFIDWAEACVSFPLIAGEYMWNRMVVESPSRGPWCSRLRDAYFGSWSKVYGREAVEDAIRLLPAYALLAVAMFYHEREDPNSSPYDGYLRSLARKLSHTVTALPAMADATPA